VSTEVVDRIEHRSEWYQVHYNLAAHRAHRALSIEQEKHFLPLLHRSRKAEIERLKFLAEEEARAVVLAAGKTIDELERANKFSVHGGGAGGGLTDREKADLEDFLVRTVEPSTAVLLAGLIAQFGVADRPPHAGRESAAGSDGIDAAAPDPLGSDRASVATMIRSKVRGREAADVLIRFASERHASYRVRYNLACYWSEQLELLQGSNEPSEADKSMRELRDALTGAPAREAPRLAEWAENDPTLSSLRRTREDEFFALTALFKLPISGKK
jgi:hypothetical protein